MIEIGGIETPYREKKPFIIDKVDLVAHCTFGEKEISEKIELSYEQANAVFILLGLHIEPCDYTDNINLICFEDEILRLRVERFRCDRQIEKLKEALKEFGEYVQTMPDLKLTVTEKECKEVSAVKGNKDS